MNEERASSATVPPPSRAAETAVAHFFERASDVEPTRLPSVGQLRWRAQMLERMAAAEQRAAVAGRPALIGLLLAAVAMAAATLFALSGIEPTAATVLGNYVSASPWRPLALLLTGLLLVVGLTTLARPRAAKR